MEALYDYLLKNFEPNKPIFLSDVKTSGINYANIRRQMKNLVDSGKIKRFDSGIYFLTTKTIFKSGSELSHDDVLEYKYLLSDNKRCGYISGLMFFNQLACRRSCRWFMRWFPTRLQKTAARLLSEAQRLLFVALRWL